MSDDQGMKPRLLLVEDDPISRSFMVTALAALPVQIEAVDTVAAALAGPADQALWLIDAHLPDGSGAQLLAELRQRRPHTDALAHTADPSPAMRTALLAAGFADVLVKPLSAARLQEAVCARLPEGAIPDWDETTALKALNGNREHVATLRQLFVDELPGAIATVERAVATGDHDGLRGALHKLRASCGFVGAARLGAAVQRLQQSPDTPESLAAFTEAARALQERP